MDEPSVKQIISQTVREVKNENNTASRRNDWNYLESALSNRSNYKTMVIIFIGMRDRDLIGPFTFLSLIIEYLTRKSVLSDYFKNQI